MPYTFNNNPSTSMSDLKGDNIKIDVVLQATGFHGWNASHGWVNVLRREGLLNRVFSPVAQWGDKEPSNDDGLFQYLVNPEADIMILLGFDWHSQPLHSTPKWQEQWRNSSITKIATLIECYSADIVQTNASWKRAMSDAINTTIPCVDALICHHEPDVQFLKKKENIKIPILFLLLGIDKQYYKKDRAFKDKENRAFFRGNVNPYFEDRAYADRRKIIAQLQSFSDIDIHGYETNVLADPINAIKAYTKELSKYRILLNLPSISSTMTSRTLELLGIGGLVLHYDVVGEKCKQYFQDLEHIIYYDPSNSEELLEKIKYFLYNPQVAQRIAEQGYRLCQKEHTLESRIKTIFQWVKCSFDPDFSINNAKKDALELDMKTTANEVIQLNSENDVNLNTKSQNSFKVSAIVSTYNSEEFIRGCLQDLVEQTLYQQNELEIVIIDSASPQNEKSIIEEFQDKYSNIIYTRTEERETLYAAWNRAIKMARGTYITNANTDDRHRSDALELLSDYLDENIDIAVVHADQAITTIPNETFINTQAQRHWNWPPCSYEQLKQGCCVGSQPLWRKSLHDKYGYFREDFKCAGDYEFWMRIGSKGEQIIFIPEIVGLYYFNVKGLEHGAPRRASEEGNLICDEYNIPRAYNASDNLGSDRQFSDLSYQGALLTEEEKELVFRSDKKKENIFPTIVIDGVFFQLTNTGIARAWRSLLEEWISSDFTRHIVVLDRGKTAPRLAGIEYRNIERYNYEKTGIDSQMLQFVCNELDADLFISTYYTTPLSTASIFLTHDMIPEVIGADLKDSMWQEKKNGILHACRYIAVSENTALDLAKFYPFIPKESITISYNGISKNFSPANFNEIINFRTSYGIFRPYFLMVGNRLNLNAYKNATLLFKALNHYEQRNEIAIVCIGGEPKLELELAELAKDIPVYLLKLDDQELKIAYSGAIALVYPSLYEGFGLPVAEAMACGCPVITCRNSSIPEVAGEAAIYVDEYKVEEMVEALSKVQLPEIRLEMIEQGLKQVKQFSWAKMAETIADVLMTTAEEVKVKRNTQALLIWEEFRKMQAQLQTLSSDYKEKLVQTQLPEEKVEVEVDLIEIQNNPLKEELKQLEIQNNLLREELKQLEIQLRQKQQDLGNAETEIIEMESSKFWKSRIGWFKIKKMLFPILSLVLGLNLLFFVNSIDTYEPISKIISWLSQVHENIFLWLSLNLFSITLILGIVGNLGLINSKFLRLSRLFLVIVGFILLAITFIN